MRWCLLQTGNEEDLQIIVYPVALRTEYLSFVVHFNVSEFIIYTFLYPENSNYMENFDGMSYLSAILESTFLFYQIAYTSFQISMSK